MRVESIIIMETKINYQEYIGSLFMFNAMITGGDLEIVGYLEAFWGGSIKCHKYREINHKYKHILEVLIKNRLKIEAHNKIPVYIQDCFTLFCFSMNL